MKPTPRTPTTIPCQDPDTLREKLKTLHDTYGLPWRRIAQMPEFLGIPAGTLCAITKGEKVPRKYEAQLGLPHTEPVPVCLEHQVVHRYDCHTQTVRARTTRKPRAWRSLIDLPATELRWMLENREDVK